jgi:carbamoyltransferase
LFHGLLREFEKLPGCPALLNTSFNDADEPIVCSPTDAVRTFLRTALDALVIGPFLVERK